MTSAFHARSSSPAEARLAHLLSTAITAALRTAAKDGSLQEFLAAADPASDRSAPSDDLPPIPAQPTPAPRQVPLPFGVPTPNGDLLAPVPDTPDAATPAAERPLSELEREYEIVTTLGGDRFMEVLLGRQRGNGALVTIHLANRILPVAESLVQRTRQAAAVLRHHDHEHVVKVLASGTHLGQPFVVHEAVQGRALSDLIPTRCPMPELDVLRLAEHIALGLQFIHLVAGAVHGDLRPECVLIEFSSIAGGIDARESESAKISGFLGPRIPWHELDLVGPLAVPSYVAPEQLDHAVHDPRTDIYAIGAIMHHLLTGEPPVTGTQAEAVAVLRSRRAIELDRLPATISEQTRTLLATALAPDPKNRFLAHQGFIVACQRALNPDLRHNLRSMRFLRKPLVMPPGARPPEKSGPNEALPAPMAEASPQVTNATGPALREPVGDDLENLDLGTRILRKHAALGRGGRDERVERERTGSSSRIRRSALSRKVPTGTSSSAARRKPAPTEPASIVASREALPAAPAAPTTPNAEVGRAGGWRMLRRDIGVVIPALLIGALIAILVGIAAGWFRV